MDSNERKYWVAFNRIPRIGRARFKLMEERFGTLEQAWHAGLTELRDAGMDARAARVTATRKLAIDPDAEMARLAEGDVQVLTWHDDGYPSRLKEIYDLPAVLYVRGELLPGDERSVAIVGTRKPTAYGRESAYQLTHDLAQSGVIIVSGLARGIDCPQGCSRRRAADHCGPGQRCARHLPEGERKAGIGGAAKQGHRIRASHGGAPGRAELPEEKPDHQRHDPRHAGCGGRRWERRSPHGQPCPGAGQGGVRSRAPTA